MICFHNNIYIYIPWTKIISIYISINRKICGNIFRYSEKIAKYKIQNKIRFCIGRRNVKFSNLLDSLVHEIVSLKNGKKKKKKNLSTLLQKEAYIVRHNNMVFTRTSTYLILNHSYSTPIIYIPTFTKA